MTFTLIDRMVAVLWQKWQDPMGAPGVLIHADPRDVALELWPLVMQLQAEAWHAGRASASMGIRNNPYVEES